MHQRRYPIPGLYASGNVAAHTEFGVGYQAGLSIAAGMTALTFDLPENSDPLRSRPKFRANGSITWRASDAVTASAFGGWTGNRFDSSIPTGSLPLPGFFVLDAALGEQLPGVVRGEQTLRR